MDRVDILTGTFGKALGGGSGGYISARKPIVDWLRQRSRPYLFSNSIPPVVAASACGCWTCWRAPTELREKLLENARYFRAGLESAGFELKPGEHPIIPVMLGDAALAGRMANRLPGDGRLRHRVLIPGRAERPGPYPHADVRSPHSPAARSCARSVHDGRPRARHYERSPMKALVKKEAAPGIWMMDVPEPKIGPNDVLIKIAKTAICGTDMHIYKWDEWAQKTIPVPMAVGHEYCGQDRGDGQRGARLQRRRPRLRRRGTSPAATAATVARVAGTLCRNTVGVGVNRPAFVR